MLSNPDMCVEIFKRYALEDFRDNTALKFALTVEQVMTKKKATLLLNVDGCIAVCFVDILSGCGAFSRQEASPKGLCSRSFLDQKRLKRGYTVINEMISPWCYVYNSFILTTSVQNTRAKLIIQCTTTIAS